MKPFFSFLRRGVARPSRRSVLFSLALPFLFRLFLCAITRRFRTNRLHCERRRAAEEQKSANWRYFLYFLTDTAPIECLSLKKNKNKNQPDAVRAVVDAVAAAPDKDLAPLLENFTWTFEKVT